MSKTTLRDPYRPRGKIDRDGTVRIKWNSQVCSLRAPDGPDGEERHYLPCYPCGVILAVPLRVVAVSCDSCMQKAERL